MKKTSRRVLGMDMNVPVFLISAVIIVLAITLTLLNQDKTEEIFANAQEFIANKAGWFYILCVNVFLVLAFVIAFSRFGSIRLGGASARPEFSTGAWFGMLFSAGMGIGLLFWSIAEPINHFDTPPIEVDSTVKRAEQAMNYTFLHWGLHAWGIYALVGLALAFFCFSRKLPLTVRSIFFPFLGDRIYGWMGNLIDIFAVLATLFGLATSLGFGVQQVAAGLNYTIGIDDGVQTQVLLIAGITGVATISVMLGIDKGVKFLSNMNMIIALVLVLAVLALGPTLFTIKSFLQNTGYYIAKLPEMAFWAESYEGTSWQNDWTIFYWGWWISWSPFVGTFIARISRGRTVREFVLGVLIVPSLLTLFWISVFGSSALQEVMTGNEVIRDAVNNDVATSLFAFFDGLPLSMVLSTLGIILVTSFFVTSSDSGSLVIDSLTSGGQIDTPVVQRIFWAITEGLVAAVLLIGGGLQALQTAAIATGLPFALILLLMGFSLYKGLEKEYQEKQKHLKKKEEKDYEALVKQIMDEEYQSDEKHK